jgi:phosphoribosylformimino-5-aminoimidazole carboxamide ribotide isomerase
LLAADGDRQTLARVGSGAGPDLDRLGGVAMPRRAGRSMPRGRARIDDLITLKRAGIAGALVASCLHDGRLRGGDIATL